MKKFLKKPFYPIFFALFPVLTLYASNKEELLLTDLGFLISLGVLVSTTIIFLLGLNLLLKDKDKNSILVSVFLLLTFSYGYIKELVGELTLGLGSLTIGPDKAIFALWVALLLGAGVYVFKTKRELTTISGLLVVVGVVLIAFPLFSIVPFEMSRVESYVPSNEVEVESINYEGPKPDIYYLVFDRYANETTLKEHFDFDNSDFITFLETKGFYVASESFANYPKTHFSLASSLNMQYLDQLTEVLGEGRSFTGVNPVYEMLQDYKVWRFLKARGYKFIHFGTGWEPTRKNKYADMNFNKCTRPEFITKLYESTILYPFHKLGFIAHPCLDSKLAQYNRVMYKFTALGEMPEVEEPKFVFAHMLIPHGPYIYNPDCDFDEGGDYIGAVQCVNEKIKELIEKILSQSRTPPIIIIQSDEGPFSHKEFGGTTSVDWPELGEEALKSHVRILNAYYFPDSSYSGLYESITPVNSFRLVFNSYFGMDYKILSDESYGYYRSRPYNFINLTERVKFE